MSKFVVISGCSGGGKSTILAELERRGYAVVDEPGRRIVLEELGNKSDALPWSNPKAFARRAIEMALVDRTNVSACGDWVFFDRGLVDACASLEHLTTTPMLQELAQNHPYHQKVFLAPPWSEIYSQDSERRHDFEDAAAEYSRLVEAYSMLGYQIEVIPKVGVSGRADFIVNALK